MGAENENPVAQQRPPTSLETSVFTSTSSRIRKASSDYIENSYNSLARLPPQKKICHNVVESTSSRCVLKEATSVLNLNKQHQFTPSQFTSPSTLLPQSHTRNIASATLQARLDVDRNGGHDQSPYQHRRTNSQAKDDHPTNEGNDNTKSPLSFLDLPPEIRNMIYSYALHYPSCANLYKVYYSTLTSPPSPSNNCSSSSSTSSTRTQALFAYSTPTILLLCKDITAECQAILHARPLIIDRLPPFKSSHFSCPHSHQEHYSCANGHNDLTKTKPNSNSNSSGFLNISTFIPRRTLQNIHALNLCIGLDEGPLGSVWAWERILGELFGPNGILVQRNRLAKLRVLIRLCSPVCLVTGTAYARKESAGGVMNILGTFLSSGNPNVFHPPETTLEVWRVQGHHAWRHEYGRLTCAANGRICFHPARGRGLVLGFGSERGQEAEQEREKEDGDGEGEDSKSQPVSVAKSNANAIAITKTKADAKADGKQERASPETRRMYPDEEMFPGSIMEFVRPLPPFFVSDNDGY